MQRSKLVKFQLWMNFVLCLIEYPVRWEVTWRAKTCVSVWRMVNLFNSICQFNHQLLDVCNNRRLSLFFFSVKLQNSYVDLKKIYHLSLHWHRGEQWNLNSGWTIPLSLYLQLHKISFYPQTRSLKDFLFVKFTQYKKKNRQCDTVPKHSQGWPWSELCATQRKVRIRIFKNM